MRKYCTDARSWDCSKLLIMRRIKENGNEVCGLSRRKPGFGLVNFIQTDLVTGRTMMSGQRKEETADRMHGGYHVAPERMAKTAWLFYALNLLAL